MMTFSSYCLGDGDEYSSLQYSHETTTVSFNVSLAAGDYFVLTGAECSAAMSDIWQIPPHFSEHE